MCKGFKKLTPEDEEAERVLREFEAGKYGKNEPDKPTPAPPVPPTPSGIDKDIDEELKRRERLKGFQKLQGKS